MKIGTKVIIRTYSAGCFFGELESRDGKEAVLSNCRRLWYWKGAATLSELATRGTSRPNECKFPAPTSEHLLTEVIEIIALSESAYQNLSEVPVWSV